jgi:hypothetical protein
VHYTKLFSKKRWQYKQSERSAVLNFVINKNISYLLMLVKLADSESRTLNFLYIRKILSDFQSEFQPPIVSINFFSNYRPFGYLLYKAFGIFFISSQKIGSSQIDPKLTSVQHKTLFFMSIRNGFLINILVKLNGNIGFFHVSIFPKQKFLFKKSSAF